MHKAILLTASAVVGLPLLQGAGSSNRDLAVYEAVLAHTVRPAVEHTRLASESPGPAAIMTIDHTVKLEPADSTPPSDFQQAVQSFESSTPSGRGIMFDGLLPPADRAELANELRKRNQNTQPFPGAQLPGVTLLSAEEFDQAVQTRASGATSCFSFSLPAYSSGGHALVYGSCTSGTPRPSSWLFLLDHRGGRWEVIAVGSLAGC
jgi:CheY-like chemotaxis protein